MLLHAVERYIIGCFDKQVEYSISQNGCGSI